MISSSDQTNQAPRTVAIVQARMASSRLPGKVLADIGGRPMLSWVIERTQRARSVDSVVVATTVSASDEPVEEYCRMAGYPVFRGSPLDVLDRFYQAARQHQAQVIVRLTADCPFIDPDEIDRLVSVFLEKGADFAANRLPPPWKRTFPIGLDAEVCRFAALERAWIEAEALHDREHVMPYLYEVEGRFKVEVLEHSADLGHLRWTVDAPPDLELVREVVARLGGRDDFSWYEVLELFERCPELAQINAGVVHKRGDDVDERMKP
jgi:spore coat polysaccharide biosynthesis protein SpsF